MKLLAFAASLRKGSLNKKLLRNAVELARARGAEIDLADFREFDMPLYDEDVKAQGFPPGAEELARRIHANQGIVLATPEYNYSIPGTLKNAIDWISRMRPYPTAKKTVLLLSTSTGAVGGARGLWQTRIPLECCGAYVHPDMFALPNGLSAFDESDQLLEGKQRERLDKQIEAFLQFTTKLSG
jgi:chromate reductase, NAD(P)H dehydrogenase (quinone)